MIEQTGQAISTRNHKKPKQSAQGTQASSMNGTISTSSSVEWTSNHFKSIQATVLNKWVDKQLFPILLFLAAREVIPYIPNFSFLVIRSQGQLSIFYLPSIWNPDLTGIFQSDLQTGGQMPSFLYPPSNSQKIFSHKYSFPGDFPQINIQFFYQSKKHLYVPYIFYFVEENRLYIYCYKFLSFISQICTF